jgi:peptidylprolyl isomerase domain and WD repeat-containing protein 1
VEHELEASSASLRQNAVLDETGHFLLYTTLLGIKLVNIETNKVIKVRRNKESGCRDAEERDCDMWDGELA